ncbi:MAG: tetraacyldisaccharide 4'-kinase [Thalassotalea sp.]|nr:tetraacyldisaccharide 4'-kinase [Thalassotalea sp.]
MRLIEKVWFEGHNAKWWLVPLMLPLTLFFWFLSSLRRNLFSAKLKESIKVDCPVVIVGNIGIGGNGKTPVVLYLVEQLAKRGVKVGVLSRGYGGKAPHYPYLLNESSSAIEAGDEPILIYQRCRVPVVVGADRIAAANFLIEQGCQIIISDDGLQHYRLKRDYELLVVDGKRLFGNGLLLPAGPLRETVSRLNEVDRIIINGGEDEHVDECLLNNKTAKHLMSLSAHRLVNLKSGESKTLTEFVHDHSTINAIAGIGDPQRFFSYLTQLGFTLDKQHGFVDHQAYSKALFDEVEKTNILTEIRPLVMTEKDAVKCKKFAEQHWWYLPVDAVFSAEDNELIITDILKLIK